MLSDRRILVTGLTGQIGHPIARFLARDNEVWGVARFSAEGSRDRLQQTRPRVETSYPPGRSISSRTSWPSRIGSRVITKAPFLETFSQVSSEAR